MKQLSLAIVFAGIITAAAIIYVHRQKPQPAPAPVAVSSPESAGQPPEPAIAPAPRPEPPPVTAVAATASAPAATVITPDPEKISTAPTNAISQAVDALLTAKGGLEKHNLFLQLAKDGQLDAAIDELKQRAAANPNDAKIPTTLGEALLNKVRALHDAGITDNTDLGILALQADQQFNAALKIDPKNWEAQFVKASTTYYWPPDAQRDAAAAQTLANLIDQQQNMPARPEFVQPYIALVKQYQKMGKMDEAAATLKIALQNFPADPQLRQMASGQ